MKYRIELYRDETKREWRWRAKARNGRIVADSGEGYKRKGACKRAIGDLLAAPVSAYEFVEEKRP